MNYDSPYYKWLSATLIAANKRLRLCPIRECQGQARLEVVEWEQHPNEVKTRFYVRCVKCGNKTPQFLDMAHAITDWDEVR